MYSLGKRGILEKKRDIKSDVIIYRRRVEWSRHIGNNGSVILWRGCALARCTDIWCVKPFGKLHSAAQLCLKISTWLCCSLRSINIASVFVLFASFAVFKLIWLS